VTIDFEIIELPSMPNAMGKASFWYGQAERKKWRKIIALHKLGKPYEARIAMPVQNSKLTLVRCSSREPDLDNLYASFKFVIDALKFNGVIADDKPSVCKMECRWEKAKQKSGMIRVKVESA